MKLIDMSLNEFSDEVDSSSPAPGGGSVSALASNIGVGLCKMMAHLSFGKKKYENLDEAIRIEFVNIFNQLSDIRQELVNLVDKDTEAFNEVMKALKMPKNSEEEIKNRNSAIQDATLFSIEVPYKTAELSLEALKLLDYIATYGNQNAITDIGVGTLMIYTGLEGAILNVKVNLSSINDENIKNHYTKCCGEILELGNKIKDKVIEDIHSKIS